MEVNDAASEAAHGQGVELGAILITFAPCLLHQVEQPRTVVNYVIAARPSLHNLVIVDRQASSTALSAIDR
jgi:hypothetical protein